MKTEKIDYRKEYKNLYQPKTQPSLIDVAAIPFIVIDGEGAPQNQPYQDAIQALYALSYTIKMSQKSGQQPHGYFDYVVPPLEGFWSCKNEAFDINKKDDWVWTSVIRQPDFVTPDVFAWAVNECKRKKPDVDVSSARLQTITEGLCVQIMHIGAYADEPTSLALIDEFIAANGLINDVSDTRRHHEIYLGDPRKTATNKLKTILRIPARKL